MTDPNNVSAQEPNPTEFEKQAPPTVTSKTVLDVVKTHGVKKTLIRALKIVKDSGIKNLLSTFKSYTSNEAYYQEWIKECDTLDNADRTAIKAHIDRFTQTPLLSIVMPVYNVNETYLRQAIESVQNQLYTNWEFCIADDASTRPHIKKVLDEYQNEDSRIKLLFREENGHIVKASNSALSLATGEFIVLLDHDDLLSEHALYHIALEINKYPDVDLIYSDEDKINDKSERYSPYFKSDWNPDLLYAQNMFSHLGVYRASILETIGGFREGYEGSQDYDLCLRASKKTSPDKIHHIPQILYHWRAIRGSTALDSASKTYALSASRKAISDFCQSYYPDAKITDANGAAKKYGYHRINWPIPSPQPLASLIIIAKDESQLLQSSLESISRNTEYSPFEIIMAVNSNTPESTMEYLHSIESEHHIKLLECYDTDSDANMYNKAAFKCSGSVIVFLDNKLKIEQHNWLHELVGNATRDTIGAVSGKLLSPEQKIVHSGYLLGGGKDLITASMFKGLHKDDPAYLANAILARNVSAVSCTCLAIERKKFQAVGAFNQSLEIYHDIDLCIRLLKLRYFNVVTPYVELHYPSAETDINHNDILLAQEVDYMKKQWPDILQHDPYYSPNLCKDDGLYRIMQHRNIIKPWNDYLSKASV